MRLTQYEVTVEFEAAPLLKEVVIEMINDDNGPQVLAVAILGGIEQLFSEEQVAILDEVCGTLMHEANEMRDDEEDGE